MEEGRVLIAGGVVLTPAASGRTWGRHWQSQYHPNSESFGALSFEFVSDFEFRISCLLPDFVLSPVN
jgi:hypothetical protein